MTKNTVHNDLCFLVLFLCFAGWCGLQCFSAVGWAAGRASRLQKKQSGECWCVVCLEQGADLHTAQLTPLPLIVSCFSKIQIGFTFLVLAHLGSPGKKEPLNGCVCVCVWPGGVRALDMRL